MQVGTISYEVRSGLGLLARDFYRNGIVNRILIIKHPRYTGQDWYPKEARWGNGSAGFLDGLDALLLFENVFTSDNWKVVADAKRRGIRVVLCPMFEYTPMPLPVPADFYVCPSLLDVDYYKHLPHKFIPVPVQVPWKRRERAMIFVHNAGHGGHGYRNGTPELLEAMKLVQSPIKLIIRAQPDSAQMVKLLKDRPADKRIDVRLTNAPDSELWDEGDVFVFPERFNGLSLPLQEAYASGMLVMAGDRFPINTWLPLEPLVQVDHYVKDQCIPSVRFDKACYKPKDIAAKIDEWYGADISGYSVCGRYWAQKHSWAELKPSYMGVLAK